MIHSPSGFQDWTERTSSRQQQVGVNHRLQRNALGAALILRQAIPNEESSLKVGALPQQILHQWIGFEVIPLVIGGAIPKGLQGIRNCHHRVNHRQTSNDWVNDKTDHDLLVNLFSLLLDFACDFVAVATKRSDAPIGCNSKSSTSLQGLGFELLHQHIHGNLG